MDDPPDTFPAENASDHLFGPILTKIPWDSDDAIQWIGSNHYKYYDGLNQGFAFVSIDQPIIAFNPSTKAITIGIDLAAQVTEKVEIINAGTSVNTGVYNVMGVSASGSSATVITVRETFPTALQSGDTLRLKIEVAVTIEYAANRLIAKGIDLTSEPGYAVGQYIRLYTKKGDFPLRYTISSVAFTSGNTEITISQQISKEGYGAIMETGIVSETDVASGPNPPDGDRVIFYAAPQHYFQKTGIKDASYFNYKGALAQGKSLLSVLRDRIPGFEIEKFSLRPQGLSPVATLAYPDATVARENLLMLGLDKAEFESLKTAALASLSIFHLQMIKLVPQGNRKRDLDYEAYYEYHAVISGLDSNGVYAEAAPSTPVVVYSRDGLIFTSASFATAEEVNVAELNYEETYHLNISSPPPGTGLKLGYYDRKQGLSPNSTFKYLYETLGTALKTIVDAFEVEILSLTALNFNDQIESIILQKGKLLLDTAKAEIRDTNSPMYNKDGALYLARLMMRKKFKESPLVSSAFISLTRINEYLDTLEKITRGLHPSDLPDFSTHPNHFPILISGFDPFMAAMGGGLDADDHLSNPSGNIAISLDGEPLPNQNGNPGIVKSVVFPVRFKEFDQGWVENFFKKYIDNPAIKMIITFSYGVNGNNFGFEIERFAAKVRNDQLYDNNQIKAPTSVYINDKMKPAFLETKLVDETEYPMIISKAMGAPLDQVGLDQKADFNLITSGNIIGITIEIPLNVIRIIYNDDLPFFPYVNEPSVAAYAQGTTANNIGPVKGSGGYYLSNEIFYRVSYLRENGLDVNKRTGHIHVGYLKDDLHNNNDRNDMLTIIKKSIINAL